MRIQSVILLVCLFSSSNALAQVGVPPRQNTEAHPWTIEFEYGFPIPMSPSMRGLHSDFESQIAQNYTNRTYPFGGGASGSYNASAIRMEYRAIPSHWCIYGLYRFVNLPSVISGTDSVVLNSSSISVGAKYNVDLSAESDFFVRAGINGSSINGQFEYELKAVMFTAPSLRFGFELGTGLDWNPWSILLLQIYTEYSDINLFGKTYVPPPALPPNLISSRGLNDGADPSDPNDHGRTIDFLLIGFGIGIRF